MENLDTEANELNLDDDSSIYTPQVSDELRPKKGQEFNTIDDVVTFYNAYAKAAGFSVRAWTTQKEPGSGKNPTFTFHIEADEEQKITRCFWSDASSRRAYNFFNDVVIFDTTYNTNRYGLIFAPIMGVNNHGQIIVFACGFLNHESVDDFVWLFNKFLESMSGGASKMIITDQDPAMTKTFPNVLPNTFHSWHILMKFSEKIDVVKYSIYKSEFSACIWKSETPEEFDLQWESLIKKSGLEGNRWLQDQYELRSRWIPTYVNHIFSVDMSSSQRAESGHAFFKKFISKNNSLVDFMIQFGRGLVRQRHEELMADHKDVIEKPKLRINHDFLEQMVDIYTNEIYYKFEAEVCDNFNYKLQTTEEPYCLTGFTKLDIVVMYNVVGLILVADVWGPLLLTLVIYRSEGIQENVIVAEELPESFLHLRGLLTEVIDFLLVRDVLFIWELPNQKSGHFIHLIECQTQLPVWREECATVQAVEFQNAEEQGIIDL
ncbi:protein FAR-RED IMPAIRED RESPONSE 1-like [Asparagus officinalis]|uniref:protein FAR-RED IMPAIRED RESPONSE 1-like n=1 Tax=Asparagus officinalis TaxID=4686 RepID=UPI00098E49FA|nr:protein FAR-RED IMPAIRED RESPONSE 1-like [Asparagus officinalis]